MELTEKAINEVHEALNYCRDGSSCAKCPYGFDFDCIKILEHNATELYISEHPEIFNDRGVKNET